MPFFKNKPNESNRWSPNGDKQNIQFKKDMYTIPSLFPMHACSN